MACAAALGCSRSTPAGAPPDARSSSAPLEAAAPASALPTTAPDAGLEAYDPPEARRERERLVRQIERLDRPWEGGPWDPRVIAAMRQVPRHRFMPEASIATAYRDRPYPIGYGQTISQPAVVALMTNALELSGRERVLEIGTGSGYQAAVLSRLSRRVYSIEIIEPLGRAAAERLRRLGYANVEVRIGDGYRGWPEHAPFDRIVLTAAPPTMPMALVRQLRDGGIIVAPVGEQNSAQQLVRWTKAGGKMVKQELGAVRFVPMVPADDR